MNKYDNIVVIEYDGYCDRIMSGTIREIKGISVIIDVVVVSVLGITTLYTILRTTSYRRTDDRQTTSHYLTTDYSINTTTNNSVPVSTNRDAHITNGLTVNTCHRSYTY